MPQDTTGLPLTLTPLIYLLATFLIQLTSTQSVPCTLHQGHMPYSHMQHCLQVFLLSHIQPLHITLPII